MSLIGRLFGTGDNPPDATKLDGTSEAALARSLSALSPDERGWITFAESRNLFSYQPVPLGHHLAAPVGGLDLVVDGVRECRRQQFLRIVTNLRAPIIGPCATSSCGRAAECGQLHHDAD